jgi:fructose-1-phosphate kinase PfkB-like protein
MAQEQIENAFVRVTGECRVCIAVIDPVTGTQTEINESGPEVSVRSVRELSRSVARLLSQQGFEFVVLSGSLPPGVPESLYADLIVLAQQAGVRAVLDASGAALRAGMQARPWMVKPNRAELESVLGRPLQNFADTLVAARSLHAQGIAVVAVTRGAEGALLVCDAQKGSDAPVSSQTGQIRREKAEVWTAIPPPIEFASAVASGDSFVAAFLWAWTHGEKPGDPESALRLATGAGAANAAVIGAGFCTQDSIYSLAQSAKTQRQHAEAS